MKKHIYTLLITLLIINTTHAQTSGISYQAVILNPNQQELPGVDAKAGVLPKKNIGLRFTIINSNGSNDYQETHTVQTDAFGMVNLFIGHGNQTSSNSFEEIDWDGTAKTLQVDIDVDGGSEYIVLSNQILTFIPYGAHRNISATGTLTVGGIATFKNDINIKGETNFERNTNISGDLSVDGKMSITDVAILHNDLTVDGITHLNNAITVNNASPMTLSGTLNVEGKALLNDSLTVMGNTTVGDTLIVNGITSLNKALTINNASPTTLSGTLNVEGKALLNDSLTVMGNTTIGDTLIVNGITNLNEALNINNTSPTNLSGTLNVEGKALLNDSLTVMGNTNIGDTLTVNGITNLNQALTINNVSPTTLSGTLNVAGKALLNDSLTVIGNTNIGDTLTVKGFSSLSNLVVRGDQGVDGEHIALFENTGGGTADGIAIRIDKETLGFRNRFITFYGEDNYVAGRIESFDFFGGDTYESFPIPDFANLFNVFDFDNVLTGGSLPSLTFNGGDLPSANFSRGRSPDLDIDFDLEDGLDWDFDDGSLPSLTFRTGSLPTTDFSTGAFPTLNFDDFFDPTAGVNASDEIGRIVSWGLRNGNPGFIPTSHYQIALVPVILAAKQLAMNQGVIYGSKGADYAEWLEKENPEEKFIFGEVVGIKGGKISKNTQDADQVLTISLAPIVLGNMPDENRKEDFEKVGFMGQLPVLVLGTVHVGDYIVASGYNDGYAKAISSENIQLQDLKDIIGKAWSSSNGNKISLINVSVGLKTNEWVDIFDQQEKRLNTLEAKLIDLQTVSDRLNKLEAVVQQMGVN